MLYKLSEEEYAVVKKRLIGYQPTKTGFIPWPTQTPRQWNACTMPCDMWTGPCCCGAWHKEGK